MGEICALEAGRKLPTPELLTGKNQISGEFGLKVNSWAPLQNY